MAASNLTAIRTKVRRLTRAPSEAQLTTDQIDDYINTFVLYDFPEHLRLFDSRKTFTFYTQPFVDVYETNTTDPTDPLYDFKNKYITVHPPLYIAGFQSLFSLSREQFFGIYPFLNSIASIGTAGDGSTSSFSGVINSQQANVPSNEVQNICLLRNNVLFSSVDMSGNGLSMIDFPINATIGNLYPSNGVPSSTTVQDPANYINYVTGQFVVTFLSAPASGIPINSQTVPQTLGIPQSLLFFDNKFTVRPVPDQPYTVQMEVYVRPTELLSSTDSPEIQQWWQYIAYGAAKKVFEDRMDLESVQLILPEYRKQELLVLRKTIVEQSNERVTTIYTQQGDCYGWGGPNGFSSW